MNGKVNARQVRIMLFIVMLLILAGAIGGFLLLQNNLSKYASVISSLNADAQSGDQNLTVLKRLEEQLKDNNEEVADAQSLVADASSYGDKVVEVGSPGTELEFAL